MRITKYIIIVYILIIIFITSSLLLYAEDKRGAFYTNKYPNLFTELLNKPEQEVNSKLDKAFNQLFYGDDSTQRVYYPKANDMGCIVDIEYNDVRSEGMSYGMMIAVQLDKKKEFDYMWKWAKTYMQFKSGPRKNYFAWQLRTNGTIIDSTTASDGEEWFVTALFFASARWGDGKGIFNYKAEAQIILDAMLSKDDDGNDKIVNMFNKKEKQVVFVPEVQAAGFTDPSYHLPHFYELWGRWADKNNQFWFDAADTSRQFFKKAAHPVTGLTPDYAKFDGTPFNPWGNHHHFQYDAWRTAMNIALDYLWFAKDEWQVEQSNRLLNFFHSQGVKTYGNLFTLDGKKLGNDHSTGLVAMNAAAALASTNENRKDFVEDLWNAKIPDGFYRYYDGLLYMFGMLQVSGNFRIYK